MSAANGGWTAEELGSIEAAFVTATEGTWHAHPAGAFELRSMGLEEASAGLLGAYHLRSAADGGREEALDFDFRFIYVLSGELILADQQGWRAELHRGDGVHHPPGTRARVLTASDDFEGVELTSPGRGVVCAPRRGEGSAPQGQPNCSYDAPEQHVLGAGPRPNVIYRDLGTAAATGGRYRVQVNRAAEPAEAMLIWHYHDMAQWFVVLDGWAKLEVQGLASRVVRAGDALTVGAGPTMRHNVSDIGPGFQILELCVPSDYRTFDAEPPV